MINQLDRELNRLLRESGARAAVIWSLHSNPIEGIVLTSCPLPLLPTGTPWPVAGDLDTEVAMHDPAGLAALVPTTLRIVLPAAPTAARSFKLGDGDLYLLMVWGGPVSELGEELLRLIREDISYLASVLEDSRFNRGEVERLRATVDDLDVGLVSLDPGLGQASVNAAAAKLLSLPQGKNEASAFAAAMARVANRAANRDDIALMQAALQRDPQAEIDGMWRFPEAPTDVRVVSHPTRHGGFDGRVWAFYDESELSQALGSSEQARAQLRINADALLDPQVLLDAVRDPAGQVIDFVYRDVNDATCHYLGCTREDLVGSSMIETFPAVETRGLMERYANCVETGEPVVLDDFTYDNEILRDARRYDLRATHAGRDSLTLTWRDVTERFELAQRISDSEERFRLLAENVGDVVCRTSEDGTFLWVSGAVQQALGAPPEYYVGRRAAEVVAPEDWANHLARLETVAGGKPYLGRARLIGADGTPHWIHLYVKPYLDADGRADGLVSTFRVIDDEVAAEIAANQEVARYQQLIESSNVGTALSNLDGSMAVVNQAMCDLAGFDMDTALQMTWMQAIPEPHYQALLGAIDDLLAARINGYRGEHIFIHADGRPRWIDMSLSVMRKPDGQPEYLIFQSVDITAGVEAREQLATARQLLAASADSMLDPQVLLEAVPDVAGKVIDFRYVSANRATLSYLQVTEQELIGRSAVDTLPNLEGSGLLARYAQCLSDGEPVVLTDFSYFNEMLDDDRRYDIRATRAGPDLLSLSWTDVTERFQIAQRKARADALYRRSMDSAAVGMCLVNSDGAFVDVNDALCEFFGYDLPTLMTKTWQELTAEEYLQADLDNVADVLAGRTDSYRMTKQYIHADGHPLWGDLSVGCVRKPDGQVEVLIAQVNDITAEVEGRRLLEEARRLQAEADQRYRRLMDNSGIGMGLLTAEGRFDVVNQSMCDFFGYDAETLREKSWQELTATDSLEADLAKVDEVLAGRIESYRIIKRYIHADGHSIWGDLSVSCLRTPNGEVDRFISQITDITTEVTLAQSLQRQTDRLNAQLTSAASYVSSILPGEIDLPVRITSRYLPSEGLAGDSFDYRWVDEDHLIVHLLDVSGHGIEPALVSISVHNMLRSGSVPAAMLLQPERVLAELNNRFPMERQGGNYFTIWYGVYELSTRTLRYASAGHPPALLFTPDRDRVAVSELSTAGLPVGMFADVEFSCAASAIPPESRLLLCSDGAFELRLADGSQWSRRDFVSFCTRMAGSSDLSLDTLVEQLRSRTESGVFDDDLSVVQLFF